jgi:uncharacterized membrane protein
MNCLICDDICDRYMSYSGKQYPVCISCFKKYADMVGFGGSVESTLELARFSELRARGNKDRE